MNLKWSKEQVEVAVSILKRHTSESYAQALQEIERATKRRVSADTLRSLLKRNGFKAPANYLKDHVAQVPNDYEPQAPVIQEKEDSGTAHLRTLLEHGAVPFNELADLLDLPPGKLLAFLDAAKDELRLKIGEMVEMGPAPVPTPAPARPMRQEATLLERVVAIAKKGPVGFEELCDKIELPPKKCRALLEEAQAAGYALDVAHDQVAFRLTERGEEIIDLGVAPVIGKRQKVAIISDTHLGSKYCMREQLKDFIELAYAEGVREILHPGDVIDGCYRHGIFELSHSGIDAQTEDLFETLPQKPGLVYHAICGNHDDTFSDLTGMDAGLHMQHWFEHHDRHDLKFHGRRGAYLKLRGAVIELWHPKKGAAYALTYHLQNHIRDYAVGQKPDILLAGHWHTFAYFEQRGVHAMACGTFQSPRSAFSKSLGGAPSIGGTIVSWDMTADGTLRKVRIGRTSYYEHEQPRDITPQVA